MSLHKAVNDLVVVFSLYPQNEFQVEAQEIQGHAVLQQAVVNFCGV